MRTVKSCGPDAPTLASSSREVILRGRRWQESPVAEESAKEPVKTIARGMPGVFRCDLTTRVRNYHYRCTRGYRAHRAPGIPCALFSKRAERKGQNSRENARRDREAAFDERCATPSAVIIRDSG